MDITSHRVLRETEILQLIADGRRDFARCDIEDGARFDSLDLSNVDFEESFVFDASFKGTKLITACFFGANVKCADFTDADLRDADFTGAAIDEPPSSARISRVQSLMALVHTGMRSPKVNCRVDRRDQRKRPHT